MSGVPALEVDGVSSGYGEALVIRDIRLRLAPGEIFVLLGKNGMGKTTLLRTVMGFLPVRGGQVRLFGREISGLAPNRVARLHVSYSPQEQALFQDLSVADNLRLGLPSGKGFDEGIARVGAFFPFLLERRRQRAGTLSGGEQKMLLVARALISRPRLMLVDEITEGLQPSIIARLADVLRAERTASGTTILLIEQHVHFAQSVADRYAVLKTGEIVDTGAIGETGSEDRINQHLSV